MASINFTKLQESIEWSLRQLQKPRENRLDAIKEFVGMHYSEGGSIVRQPVNLLELAITIYVRQLAARSPRILITAKNSALQPFARNMELALNQVPDEVGLGDTLHRCVMEAMFSFAVVKVGICSVDKDRLGYEYGEPFVDLVSIGNYFCDMSADNRKLIQYEGNDYWMDLDTAREMYEGKASDIEPDPHTLVSDQGEKKAQSVSVNEGASVYGDRVHLRDVWLPLERKMLTYGIKSKRQFRVIEWDGPERGPYHVLGYSPVPDNLLPLPPVALWRDLSELANTVFRKLGRQAEAKKTVAGFPGGKDDVVEAFKSARDGDGIRTDGIRPENIAVGGIDQGSLAFFLQVVDKFNYFAGNIDALGGLSPQSDTATQDKMLSDAASSRVRFMADQTIEFAKGICKSLAWYEWTDPVRKRLIQKPIKGTDISLELTWSKKTRKGDFLDYNFDIDVYSMQDDSPSIKLQKIAMALERFVVPFMPQIEMQGGQLDFQGLLELVSRLSNTPELAEIIRFQMPMEQPQVQGNPNPQAAAKPAHTTRTYERVNRPGATRHGKDDVMSRFLMGSGVQGSEAAAAGRRVS